MRSQAVVRADCRCDFLRILRPDARVHSLAPVAVRPAVEAALADGREVVGHEIRADLVAFVHHCPELSRPGLNRKRRRIAQPRGIGPMRAGCGVHLPDHGPIDFRVHSALGDVAVGADAHVQEASIRARRQRLRPVMVDRRRQVRDFHRRTVGAGRALDVVEPHQRILVGRRRDGRRRARGRKAR